MTDLTIKTKTHNPRTKHAQHQPATLLVAWLVRFATLRVIPTHAIRSITSTPVPSAAGYGDKTTLCILGTQTINELPLIYHNHGA